MCYVYNQWYDISCATLYTEKGGRAVGNPKIWLEQFGARDAQET